MGAEGLSYAAAGVDIEAYERVLEKVKPLIAATHGKDVAVGGGARGGGGGGGGARGGGGDGRGGGGPPGGGGGGGGGARPLFFLDYFATGRLDPEVFTQLIEGMTAACRAAGCALLGGETAEMPGVYALGDYDLAGFIVGMVEAGRNPDPTQIKAGDVLVGLPSSGLHTNGYSLVRKVFEDVPLSRVFPELGRPLGDVLLEPHASYLDDLGRMRWKGAAHITGGGILGNLPRCLPDRLGARLDPKAWKVPPIFELVRKRGGVADDEMYGTFNMGLGMVLVVDPSDVPSGATVVGEVVRHSGPDRVVIR